MKSLAVQILLLILTAYQVGPPAKQTVKAAKVHHQTAKCWKQCSSGLHF